MRQGDSYVPLLRMWETAPSSQHAGENPPKSEKLRFWRVTLTNIRVAVSSLRIPKRRLVYPERFACHGVWTVRAV